MEASPVGEGVVVAQNTEKAIRWLDMNTLHPSAIASLARKASNDALALRSPDEVRESLLSRDADAWRQISQRKLADTIGASSFEIAAGERGPLGYVFVTIPGEQGAAWRTARIEECVLVPGAPDPELIVHELIGVAVKDARREGAHDLVITVRSSEERTKKALSEAGFRESERKPVINAEGAETLDTDITYRLVLGNE